MTKKKKKQPKPEPKWRMVERVAALIEKIIDPTATVEHDVRLPDLETPGHKRQCDVVVTTGPQHRRTRTIVEVQKRDHKVKVLDFDGWIAKMRAVGAQHLICVSAAGYPASVIARAAKHGPTVRLATLRELREKSHLLDGALGRILFVHQKPTRLVHAELLGDRAAVEALSAQTLTPDSETPAFRLDDGTILSMGQIVMRMTAHYEPLNRAQSGEHTIMVETRERLTFLLSDPPVRTRLRIGVAVVIERTPVPCEVLEYRQVDEASLYRWAQIGRMRRPGTNSEHEVTVIYAQAGDGRLSPQTLNVLGLDDGDIFSASVGGHRVGPVIVVEATTPPSTK